MAASKILGRGTKRRIASIRWSRGELLHAALLFVLMLLFSGSLALWFELHNFD